MEEVLYFPALGWRLRLSKIAFTIGSLQVHWYGLLIGLGFLIGLMYVLSYAKKLNMNSEDILDVLIYSIFGGIIGARIYYVAFSFDLYRYNIWDIFKIWEGGIAIYGGIIGAFITAIILCRIKKIKLLPLSDLAVGGLILAQAIGRWGNFVNIEAYGKNTSLAWGMTSVSIQRYLTQRASTLNQQGVIIDPSMPVHPCFFYESMWCLIGFNIICFLTIKMTTNLLYDKISLDSEGVTPLKKRYNFYSGEITLVYFIWYGFGRFIIEGLRVDSLMIGNIRISQALALFLVAGSMSTWVLAKLRLKFNKERESKPKGVRMPKDKVKKNREIPITVHIGSAAEILKNFPDENYKTDAKK